MKLLQPSTWFRKEPESALLEPFVPGSDLASIRFYQRLKHDMTNPTSPSRFCVFRDRPIGEVLDLMAKPWWEHWYGREPTIEDLDYVFSGQFDKDEAARKNGQSGPQLEQEGGPHG